ncbi:hypothetical protein V8F20_003511 [Naviculisporaceae sp. PSN 640]
MDPRAILFISILLLLFSDAHAITSAENWNQTVANTKPFQSLSSSCSQNCLLNVNQKISLPHGCETYGCVCSENDSRGKNLISAYNEVLSCVRDNCNGDSPVEAGSAFRAICSIAVNLVPGAQMPTTMDSPTVSTTSLTSFQVLTTTVNGTPRTEVTTVVKSVTVSQTGPVPTQICRDSFIHRITPPSYDHLNNSCSLFVINGCRDGYGNRAEKDCGPFKTPSGFQEYRGLSHALGACNEFDICAGPLFFISLSAAYNASSYFCNYNPTTSDYVDENFEQIKAVLSEYCARAMLGNQSLGQDNWQHDVVGDNSTKGELDKHPDSLTLSDHLAIGLTAGTLAVTIGFGIAGLIYTRRTWKLAKEKHDKKAAKGVHLDPIKKAKRQ